MTTTALSALPQAPTITSNDLALSPHAQALGELEAAMGPLIDKITQPSRLVGCLTSELETRKRRRQNIEAEWLDCFRRYAGEYDPTVKALFEPGKSQLWMGFTRHKCNAAHASIMDYLAGTDERCWDLEPEPFPEELLDDPNLINDLRMRGIHPEAFKQAFAEEMRKRVHRLINRMESQLEKANWVDTLDKATFEAVVTGSMCIMGPITVPDVGIDYGIALSSSGEITPTQVERVAYRPDVRHVPIINLYPDFESSTVQGSRGIFERRPLTRGDMMDLAGQPGFEPAGVLKVLRDSPNGNATVDQATNELRLLGGDADPATTNLWEVYVWYGPLTGRTLAECGAKVSDNLMDAQVVACVWFCGGVLLKAKIHKGDIPYYISPYCRRPGQGPFGMGLPMLCKSSQDGANSAARMMIDNAAISSGPIVEANVKLLEAGQDVTNIKGWKIYVSSHTGENGKRAIYLSDIPNYTSTFQALVALFRQYLDEESFVPSLTAGEMGIRTTDTATGMSILNTNGNRMLKKVMRQMDFLVIKLLIGNTVIWNQQFGNDPSIVCRASVRPKGASAIFAREMQTQRLLQLIQVFGNTPDFKLTAAGRKIAETMDFTADELFMSDEEKRGVVAANQAAGAGTATTLDPQQQVLAQQQGNQQLPPAAAGVPPQ